MKHLTLSLLTLLALGACTNNGHHDMDNPNSQDARTSFHRVERNAGQIADEANHGIKKGVDAVGSTWVTPEERAKRNGDVDTTNSVREMDR